MRQTLLAIAVLGVGFAGGVTYRDLQDEVVRAAARPPPGGIVRITGNSITNGSGPTVEEWERLAGPTISPRGFSTQGTISVEPDYGGILMTCVDGDGKRGIVHISGSKDSTSLSHIWCAP